MGKELDDFQKFRADINEEILNCGHLASSASLRWTVKRTKRARWTFAPRNCWAEVSMTVRLSNLSICNEAGLRLPGRL